MSKALRAPARRGYGDAFYQQVADKYIAALAFPKPIVAIATEAGVPRTTAARWVKEARRRGLLGATKPGKAGASL